MDTATHIAPTNPRPPTTLTYTSTTTKTRHFCWNAVFKLNFDFNYPAFDLQSLLAHFQHQIGKKPPRFHLLITCCQLQNCQILKRDQAHFSKSGSPTFPCLLVRMQRWLFFSPKKLGHIFLKMGQFHFAWFSSPDSPASGPGRPLTQSICNTLYLYLFVIVFVFVFVCRLLCLPPVEH